MIFVALPTILTRIADLDTYVGTTPDTKTLTTLVVNDSVTLFFVGYIICKSIDAEIAHFTVTWDERLLSHPLRLWPGSVPVNKNGTIQQCNT